MFRSFVSAVAALGICASGLLAGEYTGQAVGTDTLTTTAGGDKAPKGLERTVLAAALAQRSYWLGRDVGNSRIVWTCMNTSGDNWILKKNGKDVLKYQTIDSNADYIELQATAIKTFERVRLYKDKLQMNKQGSRFNWMDIAKGSWRN